MSHPARSLACVALQAGAGPNGAVGRPGRSLASRASGSAGGSGLRSAVAGGDLRSFGAELARVIELSRLVRAERRWSDPELAVRSRIANASSMRSSAACAPPPRPPSPRARSVQRGRQQIVLHARPLPSGEEAAAEVTIGASRIELDLQLPLSWVLEVAGRGLGALDGWLVLGVIDALPERGLVGVVGIVWEVEGTGRAAGVGARLERWWTRRGDRAGSRSTMPPGRCTRPARCGGPPPAADPCRPGVRSPWGV